MCSLICKYDCNAEGSYSKSHRSISNFPQRALAVMTVKKQKLNIRLISENFFKLSQFVESNAYPVFQNVRKVFQNWRIRF